MQKRIISVCIIVILAVSIFGCARTARDTLGAKKMCSGMAGPTESTESKSDETTNEEEGNADKTVVEEENGQDEDDDDPLPDSADRDIFTYIIGDNGAVITGLQEEYMNSLPKNMAAQIEIPDTLDGYPVVEIGDGAFEGIRLSSADIPESVEIIGNSAFRNTGIKDVNLAECYNLKTVGDNAFENCNLHDQYYYVWFMEEIGERAFAGNEQLTWVNFWSGDVTIGIDAFDGCGDDLHFFVEWSREETGQEVEEYAAANGIKVEYAVATQINVPSEPLLLTPEIGSFFYGELGGTYNDWGDDLWCSFEETPDAPNFGFEDWQSPGCSKWCHIITFANQATASSELSSASERYSADNAVCENRELTWAEGADGVGIGEYIVYDQIVFAQSVKGRSGNYIWRGGSRYTYGDDGYIDYTQICIVNGYARNEQVWQENGRVKTLMMYVYDRPYARLALEDTINPQYFTIPQGDIRVANGSEVSFKFVIEEVYPGIVYEDTCITGIVVDFGNVPEGH